MSQIAVHRLRHAKHKAPAVVLNEIMRLGYVQAVLETYLDPPLLGIFQILEGLFDGLPLRHASRQVGKMSNVTTLLGLDDLHGIAQAEVSLQLLRHGYSPCKSRTSSIQAIACFTMYAFKTVPISWPGTVIGRSISGYVYTRWLPFCRHRTPRTASRMAVSSRHLQGEVPEAAPHSPRARATRRARAACQPRGPLLPLPGRRAAEPSRLAHEVEGLSARAGVAFSLHSLRRTFASLLVERGVPAVRVRDYLGHASLATTEGYYLARGGYADADPEKLFLGLRVSPPSSTPGAEGSAVAG